MLLLLLTLHVRVTSSPGPAVMIFSSAGEETTQSREVKAGVSISIYQVGDD